MYIRIQPLKCTVNLQKNDPEDVYLASAAEIV